MKIAAHSELSSVLRAISDGVLIINRQGIVTYVNAEYLRIVKIAAEEIIGKRLADVRKGARLPAVLKTGKAIKGVLRKEDNTQYVVDMSPIIYNGQVTAGISIIRDITEVKRISKELNNLEKKTKLLRDSLHKLYNAKYTFEDVKGTSKGTLEAVERAKIMAMSQSDIMITGESGTGKEVFAQAIHNDSTRSSGPFLALNCATLASNILESELFGYDDGAFTGARRGGKQGFFEVAEGGTLFLDELTELSVEAQAKLLRVLEERRVRRMGSTQERPMDVRVIASSNRNMIQMIKEKTFREDLFFRLATMHLDLPPLRERGNDIAALVEHFVPQLTAGKRKTISAEVMRVLKRYTWPGNVRELRNTLAYALSMSQGDSILIEDLPEHLKGSYTLATFDHAVTDVPAQPQTLKDIVRNAEHKAIADLENVYGTSLEAKKKIAKQLGISLATLYNKI